MKQLFIGLCVSFLLMACANQSSTEQSLYDALGQYEGITKITHQLILVIAKDERVKHRYKGANMSKFKKGMSDYVCAAVGGPCEYKGDNMQLVHAGHNYTNTEFNAIVDDLILAMEQCGIPVTTQNRLLAKLAPTYKDVVYQ
ncbi:MULTISPECIES: group 1 truncated hemoglobin [Cellvibrio]|jgi:hemoglobin|uniref:Hemoglobin n=1 Tax=Cellvibrio fibrivorans TaxID=126350 RepID=A0ABU1UU66_9GAMM|nr:group 1 truncated hemoglobin [Cellvibrio fibrivorans]MDR7088725.1 hemoglobin [Cellvibrio fibrivorans]